MRKLTKPPVLGHILRRSGRKKASRRCGNVRECSSGVVALQVVSFEQDTSDSGNGSVSSALRLGVPLKCSLMPGLQAGRSGDATLWCFLSLQLRASIMFMMLASPSVFR